MLEEWGPLMTLPTFLKSAAYAFLAAWFWSYGHMSWLIINRKAPIWLLKDSSRTTRHTSDYKHHHIYVGKGIAWGLNILWIWFSLFMLPTGDTSPYKAIVGNITLLNVNTFAS